MLLRLLVIFGMNEEIEGGYLVIRPQAEREETHIMTSKGYYTEKGLVRGLEGTSRHGT